MDNTNKPSGSRESAKIHAEAEAWLAKIQGGSCDLKERDQFHRWLQIPAHAAAYTQAQALWDALLQLDDEPAFHAIKQHALSDTAPKWPSVRIQRVALAIAAGLAVLALLPMGYRLWWHSEPRMSILATQPGVRATYILADGSRVALNVSSEVAYRLSIHTRELRLIRGEAMFDVAHDSHRPFTVSAGDGTVTALGTRFEIRQADHRITVTLLAGSINIQRQAPGLRALLRPGEQAVYSTQSDNIMVHSVDTDVVSAWTRGRLLFRATPLNQVLAEVNRYSNLPIHLQDDSLAGTLISGTFPIGDTKSVAQALERLQPIKADLSSGTQIELRRRQAR